MPAKMQIFTFLFLMLGPFKLIGPYAKITMGADTELANKIAFRAILISSLALLFAGGLGQFIIKRFGIPVPILGLSGGMILFLVALLNIIKQFAPSASNEMNIVAPTMNMALNPLAFPIIVTPYGIAAVIVFLTFCTDLRRKTRNWDYCFGNYGIKFSYYACYQAYL